MKIRRMQGTMKARKGGSKKRNKQGRKEGKKEGMKETTKEKDEGGLDMKEARKEVSKVSREE